MDKENHLENILKILNHPFYDNCGDCETFLMICAYVASRKLIKDFWPEMAESVEKGLNELLDELKNAS